MRHSKMMLSIVMILVGMLVPDVIHFGVSTTLLGALIASIAFNSDYFFGDGTKKATSHGSEK